MRIKGGFVDLYVVNNVFSNNITKTFGYFL